MENGQKTEEYWNADSADPFRETRIYTDFKIFITQSYTEEAQSYTELVFFKPLDAIVFEEFFMEN